LTGLVIVPVSDLVKRKSGPLPDGRLRHGSRMTVRSGVRRASDGVHAGENGRWSGELDLGDILAEAAQEPAALGAALRAVQWTAVLVEQPCPRRRRSRQQLPERCAAEPQVLQDLLDDGRILDAGDDLERPDALLAAFD
jgi:hypothetical protein